MPFTHSITLGSRASDSSGAPLTRLRHPLPASGEREQQAGRGNSKNSEKSCRLAIAPIVVQAAFALESEESRVLLAHPGFQPPCRMHVADRDIAFVPQRVIWEVVPLQVVPYIAVAPVRQRMQLPASVVQLQERRVRAAARLRATDAGDPRPRPQLAQRALHRFDLAQAVVAIQALQALFPQPAEARLHPCDADLRPIDLEVE